MQFHKNEAGWHHEFESTQGIVAQDIRQRSALEWMLARMQVGVRTGELYRSISFSVSSDIRGVVGVIGSDNRIALLHHEGTKPHVIVPRTKQTLRFAHRGKIVYTKLVHHPGTKPNRYLTDNLKHVVD